VNHKTNLENWASPPPSGASEIDYDKYRLKGELVYKATGSTGSKRSVRARSPLLGGSRTSLREKAVTVSRRSEIQVGLTGALTRWEGSRPRTVGGRVLVVATSPRGTSALAYK